MRPEDMVGQTLGHYQIVRLVGQGGMSSVFLAQDIHLHREVAIKVFWPKPGETRDFLRRFTREARILAQIDHPNILPVYDYGEQDGRAYLVMPYMAGGTLKEILQAYKKLPPMEAVRLTILILNALQYAHERGLIHRDIKPANILFKADSTLLLSDFGLVKVLSADGESGVPTDSLSQTGPMIAGTPEYMSPDQIQGKTTPGSDIYSVGIVLYEMLTGVRPFTSDSVMSVLLKHLHDQPRSLREFTPQVSPQLEAVVLHALEKDPTKRYQRPTEFVQALISATTAYGLANATVPVPATGSSPTVLRGTGSIDPAVHPSPGYLPPRQDYTLQEVDREEDGRLPAPQTGFPQGAQHPHPGEGDVRHPQGAQHPHPATPASTRGGSRLPIVLAVAMVLIIVGSGIGVLVSPLGRSLFGSNPTPVPTSGARGGTVTPSTTVTTVNVPPTSVDCPSAGTARAAVTAPLAPGHNSNIIYIVNEGPPDAPTFGTVKRYDTVTGTKAEIAKTSSTRIDGAQVSADGQWTLFTAQVSGQSELRMVRMDGQGLQTLLCAPTGQHISGAQWSLDQKSVVFDEGPDVGAPVVYLLNMTSGTLQKELVPSSSGIAYTARTWLDNTHVLMVGFVPNSDAPPQNLYILDTRKGANQQSTNLQQIVVLSQPCWDFDTNGDGTQLFVSQCTPGQQGSGTVSVEPSTGGTLNTIFSSSTLAIASVRVIDPSNTNLMLLISNTGLGVNGDTSKDGLWKVKADGSGLIRLTANIAGEISTLNQFSQYFWSNFSRDSKLYALETRNPATNTYTLLFGPLGGGTPTTFASISGTVLEIAGWTNL